jgi:hypothetical protein
MNQTSFYCVLGYVALFIMAAPTVALWQMRRKKVRLPMEFKLLRGPGETLRRKLAWQDETMLLRYSAAAIVPLIVACAVGFGLIQLVRLVAFPLVLFWPTVTLFFGAAFGLCLRWASRHFRRYKDTKLGYLGERAVGEQLTPLIAQGYAVFHDVPGKGEKKPFNLDHVTVGPTGVAVIETKTRRKGRTRPGFKDHEVAYDGRQLIWPWGEDRNGLDQALWEAEWLRTWIRERTGIDTPVKAILALPGWWVEQKARGPVTVVNHKQVPEAVRGDKVRTLGAEQIDLIARQLDPLCRDVED